MAHLLVARTRRRGLTTGRPVGGGTGPRSQGDRITDQYSGIPAQIWRPVDYENFGEFPKGQSVRALKQSDGMGSNDHLSEPEFPAQDGLTNEDRGRLSAECGVIPISTGLYLPGGGGGEGGSPAAVGGGRRAARRAPVGRPIV